MKNPKKEAITIHRNINAKNAQYNTGKEAFASGQDGSDGKPYIVCGLQETQCRMTTISGRGMEQYTAYEVLKQMKSSNLELSGRHLNINTANYRATTKKLGPE